MKTITQKEEQHAAACCSETKNRYICISEESEGTSPDTLFETLPDELARVAKKYGLSVKVTGAADSSTGTPILNGSLSTLRADHIVAELEKRGIPIERIVKVSRGGIADHVPVEANRHTKVELFF